MKLFWIWCLANAGIATASAHAQPATASQDLIGLEAQIAEFVAADIAMPGGLRAPLDRRLHLSNCNAPPELRMGPTMDYVIISCASAGWQFTAPLTPLPGTSVQATVNGAPIRNFAQTQAPKSPIIKKGDRIALVSPGDGFAVQIFATAEENGAEGDYIRVRTAAKGPIFRARVINADSATLP